MTAQASMVFADWAATDAALVEAIADCCKRTDKSILVGIAGAQGSGKTTLVHRLAAELGQRGFRTAVLSLDDFYLTRAERQSLARDIHPLCVTRGVPGTHDLGLLDAARAALLDGREPVSLPSFDKAADDRGAPREVLPPFDVVLLEGWCIGALAQESDDLAEPVNALERDEDPDGRWRHWENDHLAGDYARLFTRLDLRIFLRAPDFSVVEGWRTEQEATLGARAMDAARLQRFVAHCERITRAMLANPSADIVVDLDAARRPLIRS